MPHHCLGVIHLFGGELEKGTALIEKGVELSGRSPWNLATLGMAHGKAGRQDEAEAILKELQAMSDRGYRTEVEMAIVHTGLGDASEAIDWLEKAYERGDAGLSNLQWVPLFDELRADPRFQALIERLNLPS